MRTQRDREAAGPCGEDGAEVRSGRRQQDWHRKEGSGERTNSWALGSGGAVWGAVIPAPPALVGWLVLTVIHCLPPGQVCPWGSWVSSKAGKRPPCPGSGCVLSPKTACSFHLQAAGIQALVQGCLVIKRFSKTAEPAPSTTPPRSFLSLSLLPASFSTGDRTRGLLHAR